MAKLLKGGAVASALLSKLDNDIAALNAKGACPSLATVRLGNKGDDVSYENSIIKRCAKTGINIYTHVLAETTSQTELINVINSLNADSSIHGILVFRPLPAHINDEAVRSAINPAKDVDGVTNISMAGVYSGRDLGFAPCTAEACISMLEYYGYALEGKRVVVVGRSLVIGKPVAMLLIGKNATVTVCHTKTLDMPAVCRQADILIACAGRAGVINKAHLSPGQIIIDVGVNVDENGVILGDVDIKSAESIAEALTPVPGGVGSVTTAILLKHVVNAAIKANKPV